VLSAALVVSWGAADHPMVFMATWVLIGVGQAVLFYEPAFTVLTKRFDGRDRHRAVTTVTLVGGLASTVFGPLTAALEDWLGWRGAVFVLAGLLLAVTLPAFWFGLRPAPERARSDATVPPPGEVYRTRPFRFLTAAYVLTSITTFAVPVHLVPFLRERGVGTGAAAVVLGGVGLVQVLGRTTFVRLTHQRLAVHVGTWVLAAKGLGIVALVVLPVWPAVVVFLAVYGAANGIGTLTRALTLADLYGPDHYGAISSVIGAASSIAGAGAPFAAALAADVVGEAPVFLGLAALTVAGGACNEVVARPTRRVPVAVLDDDHSALAPGA
jgi:predicted MFS family arabinose efflux permease